MNVSISIQEYEFDCRKCSRKAYMSYQVPWPVKRAEAAKDVGFKNTRYGSQCIPRCEDL